MRTLVLALFALLILAAVPVVLGVRPVYVGEELLRGFPVGDDLWLTTPRDGIYVADPDTGNVRHLIEGKDLPTNKTTCGVSAFGRIWLGTYDGLYVSSPSENTWNRVGELPSDDVTCMAELDRYLWVGTSKGAARYDSQSESWRGYDRSDGLSDEWILSIQAEEDSIWFGTMRGGVCRFNVSSETWKVWRKRDGLSSNTVFSLAVSPDYVFAGTTSGLSVLDRGTSVWRSYGSESLASLSIYATVWSQELDQAWIGTGYGLAVWTPGNESIRPITKVGEIELTKVNHLMNIGGVIWLLRGTTLWFSHTTSGILGFDTAAGSWIRPVFLDVLTDQSGYGPGWMKAFVVQSNEPLEGEGAFRIGSMAGKDAFSGKLSSMIDRSDWDAYYWLGDFTGLQKRGNFTINVEVGGEKGTSHRFEIDNDVLIDRCGESIYRFLYYMRCGFATEYRAKACHLDDGVLPNGTHIDATGGWHCAGLWGGKYSEYHTYVLFNLLLARDLRPDFFDTLDREGDGTADILNEAMWGCDFLLKMQMRNGSIFHEVEKVEKTDGIIGTPDDRKIRGWMPTYNGLLAVAGLAGASALVTDDYPEDAARYLDGALRSFQFYRSTLSGGLGNSINGAALVLACVQLYRATSNETYLGLAEQYCNKTLALPFAGYYGTFVPCALGYYAELNPSTALRGRIVDYIVGLAKARIAGDVSTGNPRLPFQIPTWRLYIMDPYAALSLFAYRFTGNETYLNYGLGLIDCHLGENPYDICMLEGAGTVNPPGYGSYLMSPSNPRGAAPGSIPQGIRAVRGRPYYDISPRPSGESAETWLINTNFLQAISLVPKDMREYPLEVQEDILALLAGLLFTSVALRLGKDKWL